jgi:hypothetical protein
MVRPPGRNQQVVLPQQLKNQAIEYKMKHGSSTPCYHGKKRDHAAMSAATGDHQLHG